MSNPNEHLKDDSSKLGASDPPPGKENPWGFNAFNLLNGKIEGIDNRLRRMEYLAWALIGAIALAGYLLGNWSPEIHVHVTPKSLPTPLTK